MSVVALIDGEAGDALAVDNRGLAYGDGVFRTLLVADGVALHVDDHLAALRADAARLALDPPDADALRRDTAALAAGQSRAVVKWLLVRRSAGRGYAASTGAATRIVLRTAAPRHPATHWTQGVVARLAALRLGEQPALAGIKHLNRLEQVLAARELGAGVDELLMCDHRDRLVGGLRSNLFWVREGRLLTPALTRCGVAGTMRGRVLRLAAGLGVPLDEVEADAAALAQADEAFVTNALIGIWPLRRLDATALPAPGALTRRLQRELRHPLLT
ncbi:aminodeoxychorismate lyase [Solimonas soli]|uniref:aminodeoxychorismate lyase n=1 Tax=Solimonas soli TaxID=413479 RepID=UPI000481B278|nr:aminodeoxychorismate lyase [Solimonas soli]